MAEAIAMIQMRRSGNIHGVLHSHQSVFKELEVFGSDLRTLAVTRQSGYTPFSFTYNN